MSVWWRWGNQWSLGVTPRRKFWLRLSHLSGCYCLDIGRARIRWATPAFRPLFSERYGYQPWHRIGRLSWRRFEDR